MIELMMQLRVESRDGRSNPYVPLAYTRPAASWCNPSMGFNQSIHRFGINLDKPANGTVVKAELNGSSSDTSVVALLGSDHQWKVLRDCMYCGLPLGKITPSNTKAFDAYVDYRVQLDMANEGLNGFLPTLAARVSDFRANGRQGQAYTDYLKEQEERFNQRLAQSRQKVRQDCRLIFEATAKHPLDPTRDHIKPESLGGLASTDNLFPRVCQGCNVERKNVPFSDFVQGFGGQYTTNTVWTGSWLHPFQTTTTAQWFKREPEPNLIKAEQRQTNLASAFMSMMLNDVRGLVDKTTTQRSLFIATLPNMLWHPNDLGKPSPKILKQRLKDLLIPVFERRPTFFIQNPNRAEDYLKSNKGGFPKETEALVDLVIKEVIHPLRKAYASGRRPVPEPTSLGMNLRWVHQLSNTG